MLAKYMYMGKYKSRCIFLLLLAFVAFATSFSFNISKANAEYKSSLQSQAQELCDDQRLLPVIMYHQVLKNARKSRYIVTPQSFEDDLIELKKRGYETVFPSQVIDFVENGTPLPQKPILITFDDGHYNNMYYCQPLLKKHGCKAIIHIVGQYTENTTKSGDHSNVMYSHLTWEQIAEINDNQTFEIGNHTYNMHKIKSRSGIKQKKGESDEQYSNIIKDDISKLQQKLQSDCGFSPVCFAYPFGLYNKLSEKVISEMGFKMIFNCTERTNKITVGDTKSLLRLCRYNREPHLTSKAFFNHLEK